MSAPFRLKIADTEEEIVYIFSDEVDLLRST
jgi:hypothetical protein